MPKRPSARAQVLALAQPVTSPVVAWFQENEEANEFFLEWVRMRNSGETTVGIRKAHTHLRAEYAFPFGHQALFSHAARAVEDLAL